MIDFRALCAELFDEMDYYTDWSDAKEVKDRARAALAEPEPEGPTDEELEDLFNRHCFHDEGLGIVEFQNAARAVLARWGNQP